MSGKFSNAYKRISWAEEQCVDLKERALAFFVTKNYTRVGQLDSQSLNMLDKIRLPGPLPESLNRITLQIFDNLRASLDYAACAVVPREHQRRTYFPFGDTKREVEDAIKTKCRHVPEEIKSVFRSFKPYKRGNPPLWALNKFCNTHKHRTIVEAGIIMKDVRIHDSPFGYSAILRRPTLNRRKNEIVFSKAPGKGTIHHDVEFSIGIAFGKVQAFSGHPVLAVLRGLTSEVKSVVMATEAEGRRIGVIR
jgi:hypothetical protein